LYFIYFKNSDQTKNISEEAKASIYSITNTFQSSVDQQAVYKTIEDNSRSSLFHPSDDVYFTTERYCSLTETNSTNNPLEKDGETNSNLSQIM
jgi:hypothetical protein